MFVKQGSFLGLFSFDDQVVMPLSAFKKYFAKKGSDSDVRVKVRDKTALDEAKAELDGDMRRVRGLLPDQEDDFAISAQESFKARSSPSSWASPLPGCSSPGWRCSSEPSAS